MSPIIQEVSAPALQVEGLAAALVDEPGLLMLHSSGAEHGQARYSIVCACPFMTFRATGAACQVWELGPGATALQQNPWQTISGLLARFQALDVSAPFPLGGCFGFFGYDLKHQLEPKLPRIASRDLPLPDCHLGFYDSLLVFDRIAQKTWIVSTGLRPDGSYSAARRDQMLNFWRAAVSRQRAAPQPCQLGLVESNLTRGEYEARVRIAQDYIRVGHIYQVNLAQRFSAPLEGSAFGLFQALSRTSPAPFSAYLDGGDFQLVSSSPELFLRINGDCIRTRPIKGTRPRSADPERDEAYRRELQGSGKERAELIMITDLLRNDLGKCCAFGSVQVPELSRLEQFAHVQHLVSTVEGRLKPGLTHLEALSSCFPGGSITGAPKFRAMEIIEELEPVFRGPYTGALGYLGFNQRSQLSIIIRTAVCVGGRAYFHAGAGIVADSVPEQEYEETVAKARGFLGLGSSFQNQQ